MAVPALFLRNQQSQTTSRPSSGSADVREHQNRDRRVDSSAQQCQPCCPALLHPQMQTAKPSSGVADKAR
eukprot:213132-Heterocapsa_arctica.AAC.2